MRHVMVVIVCILLMAGCSPALPTGDALLICNKALKSVAKNPSSANIPYPSSSFAHEGKDFVFSWNHGDGLAFQNGFGAMIDSKADCEVSSDGKRLLVLSVDGDVVLDARPKAPQPYKSESPEVDDAAARAARAADAASGSARELTDK